MLRSAAALGLSVLVGFAPAVLAAPADGAPWGARAPTACPSLKQAAPPTAAQAATLLRCAKESASMSSGELWLLKTVDVEVGGPTAFRALYNIVTMAEADTTKPVHPIRGGWTWSTCILRADSRTPDRNCRESDVTKATGACWRTTFGDWKCTMNGTTGETRRDLPPVR